MASERPVSRGTRPRASAPPDAAAEASLAALRNLGPVSARLLVAAGIRSPAMLRELGAVAAFRRVLFKRGGSVSTNLLWALEGALRDERWDGLSAETRARLRAALEAEEERAGD
jgi:DNA transformation protein